jgi:hypothetical protein
MHRETLISAKTVRAAFNAALISAKTVGAGFKPALDQYKPAP